MKYYHFEIEAGLPRRIIASATRVGPPEHFWDALPHAKHHVN